MAWKKIRSRLTGKTDYVTDSAYDSYFKQTNMFEVIDEIEQAKKQEKKVEETKPVVEEKIKPVTEKPKKQQPAITPIKPLKTKSGDDSKINSEI